MTKQLTIAIASRNEIPMLVMTVLSAVEQMKADGIDGEVLVVENSDANMREGVIACLAGVIKDGSARVVHEDTPSLAVSIDRAHREADGEYVFYTDAHTLIGTGTLSALLAFHERNRDKPLAFVHAPIQWAHRSSGTRRTHFSLGTSKLGSWSNCQPYAGKIPWKGMPYAIRKDVYEKIGGLGCCAEYRLGWGVLRYLGMKPWLLGYENWSIDEGVVYHFGEWPKAAREFANYRTYKNGGEARPGIAYAVAAYVMGGEEFLRREYEPANLGRFSSNVEEAVSEAKRIGESDRKWILENQATSLQDLLADPPWVDSQPACDMNQEDEQTITSAYCELNATLHRNDSVRYGDKGSDQGPRVKATADRWGCETILDYGAGKQTLEKWLRGNWNGEVASYDPAIPEISHDPGEADLVVCSDVLEHVEPDRVNTVLRGIRRLAKKIAFVRVCTVPCTSKSLPDGSNPHQSVHDVQWWERAFRESGLSVISRIGEPDDRYFVSILRPACLASLVVNETEPIIVSHGAV